MVVVVEGNDCDGGIMLVTAGQLSCYHAMQHSANVLFVNVDDYEQAHFKKIVMPRSRRPACGALSVTALISLVTLTFDLLTCKTPVTGIHPARLPRPFCSGVRLRHATDRWTDRHSPSFYNASSIRRLGNNNESSVAV